MTRRAAEWLALAGLLALLVVVARHVSLPGLVGFINDDGMYARYAQALASGRGYVDLSLPGAPVAGRYPIGFPLVLASFLLGASGIEAEVARMLLAVALLAGVFWAIAYAYWRRWASPALALAGVAALAFTPVSLLVASTVMSDLCYGAIALLALMRCERAWREGRWPTWLGAGALAGVSVLVRYIGLALPLAVLLALAGRRDGRGSAAFGLGLALALGPWLAFRAAQGGESYREALLPGLYEAARQLPAIAGEFVTSFPGAFAHLFWPSATGPALPLLGLAALGLTILGAWRWGRAHGPIAPLFMMGVTVLAAGLEAVFRLYEGELFARYATPVLPLLAVALGYGFVAVVPARARRVAVTVAVVATLGLGAHAAGTYVARQEVRSASTHGYADVHALHAYLRAQTAPEARLLGWNSHSLSVHTGRIAHSIPMRHEGHRFAVTPDELYAELQRTRVDYVVATPYTQGDPPVDESPRLLNAFNQAYPGMLVPVWANARRNFAVFAVVR